MMNTWVLQDRMTGWSSPTRSGSHSSNSWSRSAHRVAPVANTRTRRRRESSWSSMWRRRRRFSTNISVSESLNDWGRRCASSSTTSGRSFETATSHRPGWPTRFGQRSLCRSVVGRRNRHAGRSGAGWRRSRNAVNSSSNASGRAPTSSGRSLPQEVEGSRCGRSRSRSVVGR